MGEMCDLCGVEVDAKGCRGQERGMHVQWQVIKSFSARARMSTLNQQ